MIPLFPLWRLPILNLHYYFQMITLAEEEIRIEPSINIIVIEGCCHQCACLVILKLSSRQSCLYDLPSDRKKILFQNLLLTPIPLMSMHPSPSLKIMEKNWKSSVVGCLYVWKITSWMLVSWGSTVLVCLLAHFGYIFYASAPVELTKAYKINVFSFKIPPDSFPIDGGRTEPQLMAPVWRPVSNFMHLWPWILEV